MAKMFKPEKKTVFELDQLEVGYYYTGQTGIAKNLTWGDIDLESLAIESIQKDQMVKV